MKRSEYNPLEATDPQKNTKSKSNYKDPLTNTNNTTTNTTMTSSTSLQRKTTLVKFKKNNYF
jgi:hypothetical protein